MEIETRLTTALKPYEKNAKRHDETQIANVAQSIKENSWVQPIVVDTKNVIIIGHCRWLAAKRLGLESVPVCVFNGTKEQAKKLRVLDNKLNESAWDFSLLAQDLDGVDFTDYDISWEMPKIESGSWFENRERFDNGNDDQESQEYQDFVKKFEQAKTTDDCYTPDAVYEAVADWVADEYKLDRSRFVRPFYPGGDYAKEKYKPGDIVVDNPPFSLESEIVRFYQERGVKFFVFCPGLTCLGLTKYGATVIVTGITITYENGALVPTSFATNLESDEIAARSAPKLSQALKTANEAVKAEMTREIPTYSYPDNVCTAAMIQYYSKYGVDFSVKRSSEILIDELDSQKEEGKAIFGKGFLLSEKAAAEKAAAEKAAARQWPLSEREEEIIRTLK